MNYEQSMRTLVREEVQAALAGLPEQIAALVGTQVAPQVERKVPELIRIGEVEKRTGLYRSSIYRKMAKGIFPQSLSISDSAVRWKVAEVEEWLNGRRDWQ